MSRWGEPKAGSQGTRRGPPPTPHPTPRWRGPPHTHGQEVEAAVQAGLDPQGGRHVDLGQGGHGDGVAGALGQIDGAQRQVDGQQVPASLLPCGDGDEGGRSGRARGVQGSHRPTPPHTPPPSPLVRGRTGEVELVQAVVGHGGVAGALADMGGGRGVGAQPPGAGGQPAAHPEALEQVAQQGPEQAAGQVPVGGGQRPPQRPQRRPQVLGALGEVPLRPQGGEGGERVSAGGAGGR